MPGLDNYYGVLAGMAYTVPYSVAALFVSLLPPGFNRKRLVFTVSLIAGLFMFATGSVDSLAVLCVGRIIHAICNSMTNPLFFSLAADYFPREKRGTANAVL